MPWKKDVQKGFPYDKIQVSNEYYDTLGLDRPDGTEPEDQGFEFETVEIHLRGNLSN